MASPGRNITTNSGVPSQLGPVGLAGQLVQVGAHLRPRARACAPAARPRWSPPSPAGSPRAAPWRRRPPGARRACAPPSPGRSRCARQPDQGHLLAEVAVLEHARQLHHPAQLHLAPAPAHGRRSQRPRQAAGLGLQPLVRGGQPAHLLASGGRRPGRARAPAPGSCCRPCPATRAPAPPAPRSPAGAPPGRRRSPRWARNFSLARVRNPWVLAASASAASARKVSPSRARPSASSSRCSSSRTRSSAAWVSATAAPGRPSPASSSSACARCRVAGSCRRSSSAAAFCARASPSSPPDVPGRARARAAPSMNPTHAPARAPGTESRPAPASYQPWPTTYPNVQVAGK